MSRGDILYWFERWNQEGLFTIDIKGAIEVGLVDDLENMTIPNAMVLFNIINRIV